MKRSVQEWVSTTDAPPFVDVEYLDRLNYYGSITQGRELMRFAARHYEILGPGWLRLVDVLLDTSERHQGITLKHQVTWRPVIVVYCTAVLITPLGDEPIPWIRRPPAVDREPA